MKTREMQSISFKFPRGSMPVHLLNVCIFTAHHLHSHTHEKSLLHACGCYLEFSTWKENHKDYSPTNQKANTKRYKMRQAVQTSEDSEM